jgi:hypothetical protein
LFKGYTQLPLELLILNAPPNSRHKKHNRSINQASAQLFSPSRPPTLMFHTVNNFSALSLMGFAKHHDLFDFLKLKPFTLNNRLL